MLNKIKYQVQRRQVRKLLAQPRQKKILNLSEVKTIGVVFVVGQEQEWNVINDFVKQMEHEKKQVWAVGFQSKELSIPYIFTHPRTTICHEKETMDFWGCPKSQSISAFTGQRYDLLIDLTQQPDFWGLRMAAGAEALLKVSCNRQGDGHEETPLFPDWQEAFDFIIQGSPRMDTRAFLQEVTRYLYMIKK